MQKKRSMITQKNISKPLKVHSKKKKKKPLKVCNS